MCGIVGIVSRQPVCGRLEEGLRRMEYRGYDSAGIAIQFDNTLYRARRSGRIVELSALLQSMNGLSENEGLFLGNTGIAHTRWATNGEPTERNAHPHTDCTNRVAVVHNGIIENFRALREMLEREGHRFVTDTDTEVLAHLVEKFLTDQPLPDAVPAALRLIQGTYGIAVLDAQCPDTLVVARKGSPILIGWNGTADLVVASDEAAIVGVLGSRPKSVKLHDGEVAILGLNSHRIFRLEDNAVVTGEVEEITLELAALEKGGHPHFMHKEIFEQPEALRRAMAGRVHADTGVFRLGGVEAQLNRLTSAEQIIIAACGTSYYAGMVGKALIERYAGIPVHVEYASEFRYSDPVLRPNTVVIVISQSGETADTAGAIQEARNKGALTVGIVNVVGSLIARDTDCGIYIHAGPEIGVASTKAFTGQVTVLAALAFWLGNKRNILSPATMVDAAGVLTGIPAQVQQVLDGEERIARIAAEYADRTNALYLGRDANWPVALEGALKLKEISYIHAEGYPAAEMKHGPIALIDAQMPVVVICPEDGLYDKVRNNIEQVRTRGGQVIAVATEGDEQIGDLAHHVIYVPKLPAGYERLYPLLTVVPLQLLAYHIAVLRGCDVDQPRNLAKAVTVE